MKKLMIAAVIVCTACFANAAKVQWGAEYIYDSTGTSVLTEDPGIYLAKITTDGLSIIQPKGGWDYDDEPWNGVQGVYDLVVGKDFDGDKFTLTDVNGTQLTTLDGDALVFTLSGFNQNPQSTTVKPFSASEIKMGAVPEPTSGLLLLLGVAGLALKRRRA